MNKLLLSLLALAFANSAEARVRLPQFVTDSMVVQQLSAWTISGHADGRQVRVSASWGGSPVVATVGGDGSFSAVLSVPQAGGPFTITFDDGEATTLRDVYAGEVWLCSGQSNMEMPVGGWGKVLNYEQEIAQANHPRVRFLQIKKQMAYQPADDAEVNMGGWRTCSPQTVDNFSSIAYFYARRMADSLGVHVGVIDCTWGGTTAEAWTSFDGVASVEGFEGELSLLTDNAFDQQRMMADYTNRQYLWMEEVIGSGAKRCGDCLAMKDCGSCVSCASASGSLPIPGAWEHSALYGFDGLVELRCSVDIPATWAGKDVELSLAMVDNDDITYFNGQPVGRGMGYDQRRIYTVPASMVHAGKAVIAVRVVDYEGGGGIWGNADDVYVRQGDERISLAGQWDYTVVAPIQCLPHKLAIPESASFPTVLYNAMLHPLRSLPIRGVLWYQGCANVGRAEQYAPLFQRLISDWRELWGNASMPFYFVQLAAYLRPQQVQPHSQWAALRAAQASALELDNTGMAVAIDIGDADDIHPKNKQEVARRLALIALRRTYGRQGIIDRAPAPLSCGFDGAQAVLTFDAEVATSHEGVGALAAESPRVTGFIVQTADGQWLVPTATITSPTTISLTAPAAIQRVLYNHADYPDGNLRGNTGLPIPQFAFSL